jgi:hypothetical protein
MESGLFISEEVRKAMQNEWENGVHALVKTRISIKLKLYFDIQNFHVIEITDDEF